MGFTKILIYASCLASIVGYGTEIFSLAEIEPGQRGEWKTVTEGREIRTFELEILGIAPNYTGPKHSVILARAVDPENILSGPVAGMSGSPVYVDGRLAGAYAYGYRWSKEQAIIGITPIEDMLPLWASEGSNVSGSDIARSDASSPAFYEREHLQPVPTPLMLSGISSGTVEMFKEEWRKLGIEPMAGAPGMSADESGEFPLEAGAPLAVVLMTGDFTAAATGTITHREGDKILGFGHSFMQWGDVDMPLAGARIYAVIRNLIQSFKLAQPGPLVGTLKTDRLTGIAGELGPTPEMAQVRVNLMPHGKVQKEFQSQVFPHEQIFPVLVSTILNETLMRTLNRELEETILLEGKLKLKGREEAFHFENAATGQFGYQKLALDLFSSMNQLHQNPQNEVKVEEVELNLETLPKWRFKDVQSIALDREYYRPGDEAEVRIRFESWRSDIIEHTVSVPIPESANSSEAWEIVIADPATRERLLGLPQSELKSVEEILESWTREKSPAGYSVLLVSRDSRGLRVRENRMESLPSSVRQSLDHRGFNSDTGHIDNTVVWETYQSLPGIYQGSERLSLKIKN